jgi:hypothetical protein
MRYRSFPVLISLCLILVATSRAAADPFAYVVGALATSSPSTIVQRDTLFLVDLATGEAVTIGRLEDVDAPGTFFTSVQGLAILETSGVLYGVDDVRDSLITIDTGSGQATLVGVITDFLSGQPFPSLGGFGLSSDFWFSARNGRRIGNLDPTNAVLITIAAGGLEAPNTEAIAERPGGEELWGLQFLGSGDFDLIAIIKTPVGAELPFNFVTSHGVVSPQIGLTNLGLDTAPDGTLWGIGHDAVGPAELFQVDTATATVSGFTDITVPATGQVVVSAFSLAIIPEPASAPALPPGMLAVLAISVLTLGAWGLRRTS